VILHATARLDSSSSAKAISSALKIVRDRCKSTCSCRRNIHERTCCNGGRRIRPLAA